MKAEDDFWNTSSNCSFNFDEDDDVSDSGHDLLSSATEEINVLPVEALISKHCLDLILEDSKPTTELTIRTPESTIKRMKYHQPYELEIYKKFDHKIALLNHALETENGCIITKVVLFLKNTLSSSIFYNEISKKEVAIQHYANYLLEYNNYQELADLYMATGNSLKLCDLFFRIGRGLTNKQQLCKRLETFALNHIQEMDNSMEKQEIKELLEKLRKTQ